MFQGLRQGGIFYVLEKGEDMSLKIGQVVSVSNPQPKNNQFGAMPTYGAPQELFVDVKVKIGEEISEFKQLNANMNIANSGNLVVSDSKDAMSAEVEGLLRNSKQIIESVPYHEKLLVACDAMLRELNPQFAKEKEQEEKIGTLETKMTSMESSLDEIKELLLKTLNAPIKKKES